VSVKDLDGERMVLLSQHSFLRHQIDDLFSRSGVSPRVVLETPHSVIACGMVAAGLGITLVSRWAALSFVGPNVVVRPIKEEMTSRSALIFPFPGSRLALAEAFAKDLKEEIRKTG
jgi:DNA-binding transcriptional LysR family regulator